MLNEVDRFLRRTKMAESTFGKRAMGDPRFVEDLRNGRQLRLKSVERLQRFIHNYESQHK